MLTFFPPFRHRHHYAPAIHFVFFLVYVCWCVYLKQNETSLSAIRRKTCEPTGYVAVAIRGFRMKR